MSTLLSQSVATTAENDYHCVLVTYTLQGVDGGGYQISDLLGCSLSSPILCRRTNLAVLSSGFLLMQ